MTLFPSNKIAIAFCSPTKMVMFASLFSTVPGTVHHHPEQFFYRLCSLVQVPCQVPLKIDLPACLFPPLFPSLPTYSNTKIVTWTIPKNRPFARLSTPAKSLPKIVLSDTVVCSFMSLTFPCVKKNLVS
jgi:hypothetical protein